MREVRRVGHEQRVTQLHELLSALRDLVAGLEGERRYLEAVPEYEAYHGRVAALLASGFDQATLDELAVAVPRLFWLHKEWLPPSEEESPGVYREPAWFQRLNPLESRVQQLAFALRVVGEYD